MAAKKKAEPVVSQPPTGQAASTAARATEPNADDVQSSQAPAEVQATIPIAPTPDPVVGQPLTSQTAFTRAETAEPNTDEGPSSRAPAVHVTIPIDPYPGFDEPYLQSFELLRSNAYEAVFSLGRLANAFRFSQFLYYYRMPGGLLRVPSDFSISINDCLRLLDNDTRSELGTLLLISMKSHVIPPDQDEPSDFESLWRESFQLQDPDLIPFFRHSLSERYRFSLNTRAESGQTGWINDQSGWLNYFESLYEKLLQGDRHLANWMLQGWNVDRLVRPELKIELLTIYYDDPRPHSTFGESPIAAAMDHSPFDWTRIQCRLKTYSTLNPTDRNNCGHSIFSALGSNSIAPEQPQSSVEFETVVSKWVRLLADEQLRADHLSVANTTPKRSAKGDSGEKHGNGVRLPKSPKKKGTQEAAQRDVLKAFLFIHHRFESKEDLNLEPASMNEMMAGVGKSKPMISRYLRELGFKSHKDYERICRNYRDLRTKLEVLDGSPQEKVLSLEEVSELSGDD